MFKKLTPESPKIPELNLQLSLEKQDMPKRLEQIKKTKPFQASLFELLTETDFLTVDGQHHLKKGRNYSQTFELYDFMPRWVFGHQADLRENYNGLLPALVRDFECRGTPFRLTLTAATIVQNGESVSYYPGANEHLLEIVLRKMYLDRDPQFFDGQPGMTFTINQLCEEMKKQNHSRSYKEIIQSLRIMRDAGINCVNLENDGDLSFSTIDVLYLSKKTSYDAPGYLIFSRPIADILEGLYFRLVNYRQLMSYKSNFARLLHQRLSHHFTQANQNLNYSVNLSTLLRDFGLEYPTIAKSFAAFKAAIDKMQKSDVILNYRADPIYSSKGYGRIDDYYLEITPTKTFSFEIKNSNIVAQNIADYAEEEKKSKNTQAVVVNKKGIKMILPKVSIKKGHQTGRRKKKAD